MPHAPQFAGSLFVSTQRFPHCVVPPPHEESHLPFEQNSLGAHAVPHAPQFAGSKSVTVQTPLQSVAPGPHWLLPPVPVLVLVLELVLVPVPPEPPSPPDELPTDVADSLPPQPAHVAAAVKPTSAASVVNRPAEPLHLSNANLIAHLCEGALYTKALSPPGAISRHDRHFRARTIAGIG